MIIKSKLWGQVMAQIFRCQFLIMQTQDQPQTNSHGIFGGQSGTGTGF